MKEIIYKVYPHNPPHLFMPDAKYFITGSIYQRKYFLALDDTKERFLHSLKLACNNYNWILEDWVVLDNHYHLMLQAPALATSLSSLLNAVHKFTALWIKKNVAESIKAKRIFCNYWDTCIKSEKSYFTRLKYIYYNPVKHGYTNDPGEYLWSSYHLRIQEDFEYFQEIGDAEEENIIKDDF